MALDQLIPLVHGELRRLARRHMGKERAGHTLQPTALVNEAYLRLVDLRRMRWQDRAHFFAMSARLMRRILVNFALSKGCRKRGGGAQRMSFDEALAVSADRGDDLVALDEALTAFAAVDARKAQVVERGSSAGLSVEEAAEAPNVSAGRDAGLRLAGGCTGSLEGRRTNGVSRWQQISRLYDAALERPASDRSGFRDTRARATSRCSAKSNRPRPRGRRRLD